MAEGAGRVFERSGVPVESGDALHGRHPPWSNCAYTSRVTSRRIPRPALLLFLLTVPSPALADVYPRQPGVDVEHYVFRLTLSDDTDEIVGETRVDVRFATDGVDRVTLDLAGRDPGRNGRGMGVAAVTEDGAARPFEHVADRLSIALSRPSVAGERRRLTVSYAGVPARGLRIAPTRHGIRSFFSDNWPDLARHWLPTLDHPSDKATGEMVVTAPAHYQVVSNGLLVEETDLGDGRRRSHWHQAQPISTWLYALGATQFAVEHRRAWRGRPIQTWVFAPDRDAGFEDFAEPTTAVLDFLDARIGSYPYDKLANVQSNSVSGGMESATAIFYDDDAVTGRRDERWRRVQVHEIAHQWFGNAVTEADWDHVWLSEGFATYMTLCFTEHRDGPDAFAEGLRRSRDFVRTFAAGRPGYRILHDNLADTAQVVTRQVYEKGAWVLHMLRGLIGDEAFWAGLRDYYAAHLHATAVTSDLQRAMERRAGRELGWFFDQWLTRGDLPDLRGTWSYEAAHGRVRLDLTQAQPGATYRLPIDVEVVVPGLPASRSRVEISERSEQVVIAVPGAPDAVTIDPGTRLLTRDDVVLARR
jgi:aminopeptidase N